MQINVSQLLQEPVGTIRDYRVNEIIDIAGDGKDCLVQGDIRLLRTNRSIVVKGVLHTDPELSCSRCLGPFPCPLSLNIEEEYVPTIDVVSGAPLPVPEEPGAFVIDEHHLLDLNEAIRQYALTVIPMKPLCRQDCAGLCQNCGHNLNQGPCNCPPQEIDPRWSKLIKLVK